MSTPWVPPRRTYHLRVFIVSLALVLVCLLGFLFGLHMEAVTPATGVIAARDQQDIRAALDGVIELGWFEGAVPQVKSSPLAARLDYQGNGLTDPARGDILSVFQYKLPDGREVPYDQVLFHKLVAGDSVWSGQVLGHIRADDLELRLRKLKARLEDLESRGDNTRETLVELHHLRSQLARANVRAPEEPGPWLVLKSYVSPGQAVKAGDPVALLAPLDRRTGLPREFLVWLDIQEKHAGDVRVGQEARIYSTMFNHRLHGRAEAKIDKLEPLGEPGPNGEHRFRARAAVTHSPFPLQPGSTCKAEIVVGRKQVYRIILDQ
jgi:hypothetical protein